MTNIAEKYAAQFMPNGGVGLAALIQAAVDEQAEAFKGELQVYDGMVRELTKTVEDMRAEQSVPVVGEPVGWRWVDASGEPEGVCIFTGQPSGGARRKAYERGFTPEFVIAKPTHSITAPELERLRKCEAALLALKEDCQTSNDCQYGTISTSHVARIVDAAIAQGKGE